MYYDRGDVGYLDKKGRDILARVAAKIDKIGSDEAQRLIQSFFDRCEADQLEVRRG